jgi:hypothetical protein
MLCVISCRPVDAAFICTRQMPDSKTNMFISAFLPLSRNPMLLEQMSIDASVLETVFGAITCQGNYAFASDVGMVMERVMERVTCERTVRREPEQPLDSSRFRRWVPIPRPRPPKDPHLPFSEHVSKAYLAHPAFPPQIRQAFIYWRHVAEYQSTLHR